MVTRANRPTLAAVNRLLRSLTLDEKGETVAAIAKGLARTFDDATGATSGAGLSALAGISKELRSTLEALVDPSDTRGRQLIASILGGLS
jgi:hypothetical protein